MVDYQDIGDEENSIYGALGATFFLLLAFYVFAAPFHNVIPFFFLK